VDTSPIDESLAGRTSEPRRRTWASSDALLYVLAVGAGQQDPSLELEFTTENSHDLPQRVLPTFANVAFTGHSVLPTDLDFTALLHAEQAFTLAGAIPVQGEVTTTSAITGVYDRGPGALIVSDSTSVDADGQVAATIRSSVFMRGYGGFGGEREPKEDWELPSGKPDHVVTYRTRPEQSLLYRLTGDRNPLHSDPAFAAS
jgi:hypothetical protein